jgi:regulator of ribosome biosynthesis
MTKLSDKTFNVSLDLGNLIVFDTKHFNNPEIHEEDMTDRCKENLKLFYSEMFKLSKTQKGEDEENRDYDKAKDNVTLPEPLTIFPRSKPIPKQKPLTKWEKYRADKGLAPRQKRSRMVYSELAKDWVPRWGKGSEKKIQHESDWAIEEKTLGENPFSERKQEKKLNLMKEKKKQMKNEERNNGRKDKDQENSERPVKPVKEGRKKNKKMQRSEMQQERLKKDKKVLDQRLETGKNKFYK